MRPKQQSESKPGQFRNDAWKIAEGLSRILFPRKFKNCALAPRPLARPLHQTAMGKSKGRRKGKAASGRSGGGGGGNTNAGHGHFNAGGAPSSASSFGGGMINPAFLAAAARDAAAAASARRQMPTSAGAGVGSSSSKKKRKRAGDNNESTANNSAAHKAKSPNQVDSVSKKSNKSKKRKKMSTNACSSTSIEQYANANSNAIFTFGHPRWTDLEQLVRLLLFPLPWVADAALSSTTTTGKQSKHHSTPGERPILPVRIIFLSQADRVRELAMLFKPLLHPMPVMMIHNKMKRRQLEVGMRELMASLVACNGGYEDGMEDTDAASEGDNSLPSRGPVIFVADSAIDRMISAFRSCRIGAGMTTNTKTNGGKGKNKKQRKTMVEERRESPDDACNGQRIPLGVHFDEPKSEEVRNARSVSLSSIAAALQNDKINIANTDALEIVLDGKRSSESNAGQLGQGALLDGSRDCLTTIAAALPSNEWIPRQSDQQIVEGIVNSAKRVREGPVGSPKERSAKEKLLARMAVLDARLQARARLKNDYDEAAANDVGLPAVLGITDVKISSVVEKMRILGMIAATNPGEQSEREAAQTRWMDNAKGRSFGGTWKGSIRHGASGDDASRDLASKLSMWRSGNNIEWECKGQRQQIR